MDGPEYRNALSRLTKVKKDFEALIQKNMQLVEANRKLRKDRETFELREQARERVFESITSPAE